MKKPLVLLWLTPIMILASLLYRSGQKNVFIDFPSDREKDVQTHFQLILFFSKNSCSECLEIISVLNSLPEEYDVKGVVPNEEFRNINEVRRATYAAFPLFPVSQFKKFEPRFIPSVVYASKIGTIYAVLPVIPETKSFFGNYIDRFHLLMDSYGK